MQHDESMRNWDACLQNKWVNSPPQAPDRFNPKVTVNTCGIIQNRVAQIKKVIALMAYFLLSDH